MTSFQRAILTICNAAPQSEPIHPVERRVIGLLILAVVAGAWLSIWAVHHLQDKSNEGRFLRTTDIWVSLQAGPPLGDTSRG